ncbi:lantibiotic dehydratase [Agathobacter sp.]
MRKFLNRAATRTTPFGLFAGVEFGNLGDKTDIELNCISQYYKRARVDMEWLSKIVIICENNPTYWNHLRFRFNSDCYEAGNLMSFLKKQRGNEKSPSVIDGLIEKVGMYAMEKKSVSAEQVSRNFSINSEQAENVIKQLETIGVLGKKNEDGTHTVMMDKAAFVKRIRGYQELAERMRAVAASKNANLSDVTISKKLIIEENDHAVKTRVPGTWGEEARYVWLRKENIMEIHGGKTILYEYMGRNLHKNRFLK